MHLRRRKMILTAAAAFAFGIAFAAQPTAPREEWSRADSAQRAHWVPGTDSPMSAYESRMTTLAPPL